MSVALTLAAAALAWADRLAVIIGIAVSVNTLYDAYVTRRRNREADDRDRARDAKDRSIQDRIADLQRRVDDLQRQMSEQAREHDHASRR